MSKKRLYEIAKELEKSSKEVVERAKSLGLDVKSHSSSVEEEAAKRIKQSFQAATSKVAQEAEKVAKQAAAKEQKSSAPAPKVTKEKATAQAETVAVKPTSGPTTSAEAPVKRPKSRNFKAEREAKAKQAGKNTGNQNRSESRNKDRDRNGKPNRDRRHNDRRHNDRNRQNNRNDQRPQQPAANQKAAPTGGRIDFKARAAALKAEQNAEYSRQSEERFYQKEAAKKEKAKQAEQAREAKRQAKEEVAKATAQAVAKPKVAPAVAPATNQANDTRRKKQNRPEKSREDNRRTEDGPKGRNKKSWNNQNQVRNQRNSNWNKKKNKGRNTKGQSQAPVTERKFHELPKEFEYTEGMTVADIAKRIKREPAEIVKKLFMMGVMATQNQSLDKETIELLMMDYGIEAHEKVQVDNADIERFFAEEGYLDPEKMVERPPVVTIMGHVDHGKTTLLDTLRNSRVATGEAGGITQHIGAYQIEENGKKITFLDTPGHAAFTSMRARGASVTDITILIVAADDGVMPQTIEAINHSKAAGVPIIVAINKIDKPGANPERVIGELAEHGVMSTAWGGDSEFVEISAKFGKNINELLETVLLVAELQELKADPTVRAIGTVIEARLDKGKGAVATLLVQQGTLHVQDPIVVGNTFGRVRAMTNDLARRVKEAGPSTPVSITGLNETPMAGDHFAVYEDEKAARAAGEERAKRALMKQRQATHRVSLENLFDTLKDGEMKSVNVIIKADVQGSAEALSASLQKIDVEGVKVTIVHSAVGAINESDVTLAEASDAFIIGFNVRPTPQARQQADSDGVEIRLHSIIYKVIEEVEDAMKGMLDPEFEEKIIGEVTIRETFKVSKVGTIGGFMVSSGKITRDSKVRVIRDGVVIYDGELASLKHYKDDVKELGSGQEGGLMIDGYNDISVDDVVEAYIMEEIKR